MLIVGGGGAGLALAAMPARQGREFVRNSTLCRGRDLVTRHMPVRFMIGPILGVAHERV